MRAIAAVTGLFLSLVGCGGSGSTASTSPARVLINDRFDSATAAFPLFDSERMAIDRTDEGHLEIRGTGSEAVAMYPDPLPDNVEISFEFKALPGTTSAGFGVVLMTSGDSFETFGPYVVLFAVPKSDEISLIHWEDGPPQEPVVERPEQVTVDLPEGVTLGTNRWHEFRIRLGGGGLEALIDGESVLSWSSDRATSAGYWGLLLAGFTAEDTMVVDNVWVERIGATE